MKLDLTTLRHLKGRLENVSYEIQQVILGGVKSDLMSIANNVKSDNLNNSINSIMEKIDSLSSRFNEDFYKLILFMDNQLKSYTVTNEEVKAKIERLIELLNQTFDEQGNVLNTATAFIESYSSGSSQIENYLSSVEGKTVTLPEGLGRSHTYMGWQKITAKSSNQYKLREAAGMNFDEEGFGKIGDRYVVATTTTFGNVGDYIDVVQNDGTIIKGIIGDIKNQNDRGCTIWGHDNGQTVVEFVVDKDSWYDTEKTVVSFHPEWKQNISKIVNKGNYFDLNQ